MAKPCTFADFPQIKGNASLGNINAKSGRKLVYEAVVNNVPFSDVNDIINVFDDEGIVSAILWRNY